MHVFRVAEGFSSSRPLVMDLSRSGRTSPVNFFFLFLSVSSNLSSGNLPCSDFFQSLLNRVTSPAFPPALFSGPADFPEQCSFVLPLGLKGLFLRQLVSWHFFCTFVSRIVDDYTSHCETTILHLSVVGGSSPHRHPHRHPLSFLFRSHH